MNKLEELRNQVQKFFELLVDEGEIEETGQKYRRVTIDALFDKDRQELYNILEKLKDLSM